MEQLKRNAQAIAVGASATFIGIGLERFAYTPLIPALIAHGWFDASAATFLGAANLLGYLLGAVSAQRCSARLGDHRLLALACLLSVLSFVLCAVSAPFAWFFVWRAVSGVTGGWLMVIGPSIALSSTPPSDRPIIGTLAFMGIGAGALVSALAVPSLLEVGLTLTWLMLGFAVAIAAVIGITAHAGLPAAEPAVPPPQPGASAPRLERSIVVAVVLVCIAYMGDAIGFVPHTVFWVDFLERDVGLSTTAANTQWAIFGFGALCGPILAARLVGVSGWRNGLAIALLVKAIAVGLPFVAVGLVARSVSSFAVGALVPGVVAITSGRIAALVGAQNHKAFWGKATALFAIGQAASGYAMAGALSVTGDYRTLFLASGVILGAAAACALASGSRSLQV
ncbi:YbfB/YjiJ family MFS transporter [Salinisphaera sp.]|uniref:YbfB/YjiJ family MFS transporter n=1 Tax=Salinisphaera sp. TaxID=1914330 RepID=UPI000C558488|nr:YbfB/YjiJ family MFS transporter [Salinisphaera sp.]MBS64585.1 MFS transporter [Salinisphaera sp.]